MNHLLLTYRNLTYHWKTLLAVFSGAMISTAVLTGALMLGDSLRFSLEYINLNRLGRIEYALASNGVFFKADLADRIKQHSNLFASSVLATNGIAVIGGGKKRINQVRIFGVGDEFWKFRIDEEPSISIPRGAAIINQQFAKKSGLKKGDEFIIRAETPSFMPADTVLIQKNGGAAARLQLRVHEIISDTQLGNFGLDASQLPPMNVFMSLSELSLMIDMQDRANLIVAKTTGKDADDKTAADDSILKSSLTLDDLGLELRELASLKVYELKSKQLFFSPLLSRTALESGRNSIPVFSYFINEFSYGGHQTPYSFIAGLDQPMLPVDLTEDEIIINQWMAEDLNVEVGQRINLRYYVIGPMRTLGEEKISLRVKKIVPIAGFARDMDLMPDFPGLSQKETCNDWDPGFPVDLTKVRIKDEEYWRNYKGTPKAFVSFITAQKLWSNKYGNLTAVRYPIPDNSSPDISKTILRSLDPKDVGLAFEAVRKNALLAAKGSVDFGQLFLGLSFFIIISAMLLLSVFFSLNMEQRRPDMAILLSLGFKPSAIRKFFLQEGAIIALTGSLAGIFAGILYLYSVAYLLETLWEGAVGNTILKIKITPSTLLIGFAISILLSMASMWFAAKRQLKSTAATLLSESGGLPVVSRGNSRFTVVVFWLSLTGIIIVFLCAITIRGKDLPSMFFGAGFLLLISSLTLSNILLGKTSQGMKHRFDNLSLIVQNLMRRRGRNLIVAALMAVGIFMVYSVGINRHGPYSDQNSPQSGTGGFQFYCESTLPIVYDLNTQKGKSSYGLDGKVFKELKFVQLRMKSGDDASCLNLNRVRNPALLGVDPTAFGERKAFSFVKTSNKIPADNAWESLNTRIDDNTIAGIADQSTILWSLGKSVGDTLDYIDESGKPFKVKLIAGLGNSVFQGRILISGKHLEKLYPSVGGTRVLLVNAPLPSLKLLQGELSEKFEDIGLDVMPASERLADFNKVENTYLDIFLMLGALGFIIGTAGLGAMTMKNIMERKKEFAVMQAVGFSKKRIMHILLLEHSALVGAGLACGLISAFIAVTPSLLEQGAGIPWLTLFLISAVILVNVVLWVGLSLKLAMPLNLVQELKNK